MVFKILGNKNLEQNKNFCEHIVKIENILKLWGARQLTLEGRTTVFKSLAVSKVIQLLLITELYITVQLIFLHKIQKNLFWQRKKTKK